MLLPHKISATALPGGRVKKAELAAPLPSLSLDPPGGRVKKAELAAPLPSLSLDPPGGRVKQVV